MSRIHICPFTFGNYPNTLTEQPRPDEQANSDGRHCVVGGTISPTSTVRITHSATGDIITCIDSERVWGGMTGAADGQVDREVQQAGMLYIVARRTKQGHLVPLSLTPASMVPLRPVRVVDSANTIELLLANEIEGSSAKRSGQGAASGGWEKGSVVSRAWAPDAFATAIPPGYRLSRSGWKKDKVAADDSVAGAGQSADASSSSSSSSAWSAIISSPSAALATPSSSSGLGDSRFMSHIRAVAAFSGAKVQRNLALAKRTAITEGDLVGGEAQGAALADLVAEGEREKESRSAVGFDKAGTDCTRSQALASVREGEVYVCPDARPPLDPDATSVRSMFDFTHIATGDLDPDLGTFRLYLGLLEVLDSRSVLDNDDGQRALAEKAKMEAANEWKAGTHTDGMQPGLLLPLLQHAVTSTTLSLPAHPKPMATLRLFSLLDALITFELALGPRIIRKTTVDKIVSSSKDVLPKKLVHRLCEHFGLRISKNKYQYSFPSRSRVKLKSYIVTLWVGPCTGYVGGWVPDIATAIRSTRKEVMRVVRHVGARLRNNLTPEPPRVFNHTSSGVYAVFVDGEPLDFPDEMLSVEMKKRKRIAV